MSFVWKRLLGTVPSLLGVIILTFFISHALPGEACEGADAFGRRLRPWRVDDLVAARVELERQLPVFGDARAPADLAQHIGPDHVRRARDHLQRADRVLEGPLDHVAARVLGADGLGQPAL